MGLIFIGRRHEVLSSPKAQEWLQALNYEHRAYFSIRTLDRFVSFARSRALGGCSMSVPPAPVALTDRELRAGLPPAALSFVQSDFGRQREFAGQRLLYDYSYFDGEEAEDDDEPEQWWTELGRWFGLGGRNW